MHEREKKQTHHYVWLWSYLSRPWYQINLDFVGEQKLLPHAINFFKNEIKCQKTNYNCAQFRKIKAESGRENERKKLLVVLL